jgi:hypothetical protein
MPRMTRVTLGERKIADFGDVLTGVSPAGPILKGQRRSTPDPAGWREAQVLACTNVGIALNEHTDADGATMFQQACAMGLEGIVSKRLTAPYRSGPSRDWIRSAVTGMQFPKGPPLTRRGSHTSF